LAKTWELNEDFEEAIKAYEETLKMPKITEICKSKCLFSIGNCFL
jgi:hypothetical protein